MGLFKFNKKEENMQRMNDEPLMNAPARHRVPDKYAYSFSPPPPLKGIFSRPFQRLQRTPRGCGGVMRVCSSSPPREGALG